MSCDAEHQVEDKIQRLAEFSFVHVPHHLHREARLQLRRSRKDVHLLPLCQLQPLLSETAPAANYGLSVEYLRLDPDVPPQVHGL